VKIDGVKSIIASWILKPVRPERGKITLRAMYGKMATTAFTFLRGAER
jgi:hypothetical protein